MRTVSRNNTGPISHNQRIPLLVIVLLTTACAVGPEYRAPKLSAPTQFESQSALQKLSTIQERESHSEETTTIDWWHGFEDELLQQLVEQSLRENHEIGAAYARVVEAIATVQRADSGDALLSTIGLDLGLEDEQNLGTSSSSQTTERIFGVLAFSLPLDFFGRTQREVESAAAELLAARANLRGSILAVSAEVASEYVQIRGTQRQVALLRESVALQEKTLEIVRSRYNAGLSPELDLRRAEAAVETLRADIPPLEEALTRSRHRIATLSGTFHGLTMDTLGEAKSIPRFSANVPDLLPWQVLRLRPDVQAAEAQLKQSIAEIGVAEAEWYPQFTLFAEVALGRSSVSATEAIDLLISSIALSIQQTLTDGGARRAEVAIAEARAQAALSRYRQTLLFAIEEVEGLLAGIHSSSERQASLRKAVEASERSFYQAEILYRQGLTSFLDVVDAQRVLASAQQQLASSQTRYAAQIAELFRVLGTQRAQVVDSS